MNQHNEAAKEHSTTNGNPFIAPATAAQAALDQAAANKAKADQEAAAAQAKAAAQAALEQAAANQATAAPQAAADQASSEEAEMTEVKAVETDVAEVEAIGEAKPALQLGNHISDSNAVTKSDLEMPALVQQAMDTDVTSDEGLVQRIDTVATETAEAKESDVADQQSVSSKADPGEAFVHEEEAHNSEHESDNSPVFAKGAPSLPGLFDRSVHEDGRYSQQGCGR